MKNEVGKLDAVPSKRLFLSIIADYDLNKSICELVDNGIDVWIRNGKRKRVSIDISLDKAQQTISVVDDAGGLKRSELRYLVGPGHTGTDTTDETIGIFGVGTKRAVVALAQDIKVKTRYRDEKTFQIDLDDKWLEEENWELPLYEIDSIEKGTTLVELQKLRTRVTDKSISRLEEHLEATYAKFIADGSVSLKLNEKKIHPKFFENWAYPPGNGPRKYVGEIQTEDGARIKVEAIAGLIKESSPSGGEYGVYFYCNDRLIGRALKTFEVGFAKGLAGAPHPKVSLTRIIVSLKGDARLMPWNSSKSDINTKNEVFVSLHNWLIQVVSHYAALSRIWVGKWPKKVFRYKKGKIQEIFVDDFVAVKKSLLPPLPRSRPRYGEVVIDKNKTIAKSKPWVKGLYEGIIATDIILKKSLEQKNRIALIVLDSTLEIAIKEYLVNDSGTYYKDSQLLQIFSKRHLIEKEIVKYVSFTHDQLKKMRYYHAMRNKLTHERVTVGIANSDIEDFQKVVESVLKKLYRLKF